MFAQALCSVIEKLINQALVYNIHGARALKPLHEKTLTVKLAELGFPLSFYVNDDTIHVLASDEHNDCTLITSISSLVALKEQQQLTELIKQDKLDILGDIKVAQRFADIAESLDIDWQTELAKRIGDIPAYKLGQLGKNVLSKLTFAAEQIQADASEWFVHEKKMIVTESELTAFNKEVTQVTKELDDISQRIDALT